MKKIMSVLVIALTFALGAQMVMPCGPGDKRPDDLIWLVSADSTLNM